MPDRKCGKCGATLVEMTDFTGLKEIFNSGYECLECDFFEGIIEGES